MGIHLIQLLEKESLPPGVELVDGGTSTLDILPLLKEADKIIVGDAMQARGEPGSIYRCRPQDLIPSEEAPMSLHHIDFIQALKMAKLLGDDLEPRTVIFGVEPGEIGWEIGLTPPVQKKMPLLRETGHRGDPERVTGKRPPRFPPTGAYALSIPRCTGDSGSP